MAGFYSTLTAEYGQCPPNCNLCEEACIAAKADSKSSRIKSIHLPELGFHGVVKCIQCSEPACKEVCPTGAISKSSIDGIVRINKDKCVGCAMCTLACPYGGIYYDVEDKHSFKCDNCDGDPKCVDSCIYGVLDFVQGKQVFAHLGESFQAHGLLACQGCAQELAIRQTLRVLGQDIIILGGPGCSPLNIMSTSLGGAVAVSNMLCFMTNAPAVATGVGRYLRKKGKDPTLVVFAGDGMTADVGFQALSGAAERGEKMIYICLDNEAYMNTGIQRSGTTPYKSWTTTTPVGEHGHGKQRQSKYIPLLMAFHNVPYVATASTSFLYDFIQKLLKAKTVNDGMAYIHLLCPCPTGWRSPINSTVKLGKMAVETNYFPLWEEDHGKFRFTYTPKNVKPAREFIKLMRRFSHITEDELKEFQEAVDTRFNLIKSLTEMTVKGDE